MPISSSSFDFYFHRRDAEHAEDSRPTAAAKSLEKNSAQTAKGLENSCPACNIIGIRADLYHKPSGDPICSS
jgi:hypothetical protein